MEDAAVLQTIENDREIRWDSDSEFLFEYQKAMLLALKELGTLDEMQYRDAVSICGSSIERTAPHIRQKETFMQYYIRR